LRAGGGLLLTVRAIKTFKMNSSRLWTHWVAAAAMFLVFSAARTRAATEALATRPTVNVILWFDTEDYLLPADDDADKRLADMLTERGIHATFKVVGEKARVLEKRGRRDVIEALRKHTIGYHSNFHSVHPAPAEYLADCGLLDGIQEFVRHEARGAADVRRIFNVPTLACYGQPGSSWVPQAVAALGQCGISNDGIPCYLDSGRHIGVRGKPYWYCGALNVYDMSPNETRMDLWAADGLPQAKQAFAEMSNRLAGEGGGLISIYYHPCEWVHMEFWDGVNFRRGANPPREQWKPPAQRPAEQTNQAFERFGAYVDFMRKTPGVQFVTAAQLPALYPDALRQTGATAGEILELARRVVSPQSTGIDFQMIDGKAFSPADQFALLASAMNRQIDGGAGGSPVSRDEIESSMPIKVPTDLLGPDGEPPTSARATAPMQLNWYAFRDAAVDANDFVRFHHRIPARVFIGPDAVAPGDFLAAIATQLLSLHESGKPVGQMTLHHVDLLTARRVAKDEPGLYGGWIIHRENFRAPKVLEVARLQAWTLKPAIPAHP
jgi:hypothetical protein